MSDVYKLGWNMTKEVKELGLRTKGISKNTFPDNPLISIVTVVFNAEAYLEDTILSIINQSYENIELIIIDGGSTDGTTDIILKYANSIDYAISEPDFGIYDAMNKGIKLSKGEWVNFMNAGDVFFSKDSVANIFEDVTESVSVIYGDLHIRYNGYSRIQRAKNPCDLWKGMQFSHQATFTRLAYHKLHLFEYKLHIVADMNFFLEAYNKKENFKRYNDIVASVLSGGLSDSNRLKTVYSSYLVARRWNQSPRIIVYYAISLLETAVRQTFKKILPVFLVRRIILAKS